MSYNGNLCRLLRILAACVSSWLLRAIRLTSEQLLEP